MSDLLSLQPKIVADHQIMLERLSNPEKPCFVRWPSQLDTQKDKKFELDLAEVLRDVSNLVGGRNNIRAIILFGSSARFSEGTITNSVTGFFGNVKKTEYRQWAWKDGKTPQDIDIFVLVKDQSLFERNRLVMDHLYSSLIYGDYHDWVQYGRHINGLDFFALDQKSFEVFLTQQDSVALSILRDGILVLGESPWPLGNPIKVQWDNQRNPSFTYKQ